MAAKAQKRKRDRRVKLEQPRSKEVRGLTHSWTTRYWKKSLPFYSNERGLLTHRVRYVSEHIRDGELSHRSVTYLCNNGTGIRSGGEFLATPDRLLCQFCEFMAARQGKPSADKLTGRHCHVGKLRVEQVCCQETRGNN